MGNLPPLTSIEMSNAPFNEKPVPLRGFSAFVTEVLSKSATITTDEYTWDKDECRPNTDDIPWNKEYKREHLSALDLIQSLANVLKENMPDPIIDLQKHRRYTYLLKECEGWESDEFEVTED